MATLNDSLVSASSRRLSLRRRTDLSVKAQRHQGKSFYVVKDPVGLGYFRLREEEYAVLMMLDGQTSLDQIKTAFEKQFAPQQLSLKQLQWFIGQLHRNGLIISNVGGQGEQLLKRRGEKIRQEWFGKLTNLLALRFKGIDPEGLLTWMDRWLWWIYTPWCVAFCICLWLSAATLVAVQFDTFQSKLPAFHEFFQAKNAVALIIALGITKIIHEFGHGLTCKHFGGECHEMGVMLLVFTPCLYCNVSDSWMLPNKWHRIAISAGGIWVELCIASVCTFVWWFTQPGLLNYVCLSTMFICSVSTVLFNGNPLLRYDGYYILSDLLEIPNLWQKSRAVLNRSLGVYCLGLKWQPDPFMPEKNHVLFGLYAVASAVYRWVVMFSILWFLHEVFKPYRLQVLGHTLALFSIAGLIGMPAYQIIKFFWVPGRTGQVKPIRAFISLTLLIVLVAGILLFPLPRRVFTTLVVEPQGAKRVYVTVPGKLEKIHVKPGDVVKEGDLVAELSNLDLKIEIAELEGNLKEQELYVSNLEVRRVTDPLAFGAINPAKAMLEAFRLRLKQRKRDVERLQITSPVAGTILPPPDVPKPKGNQKELREWTGSPMDPCNVGGFLKTGSLVCMVGDPRSVEAVLVIDQGDIEFIREEQQVEIKLEELPSITLHGQILEISQGEMEVAPQALSQKAGGELQTRTESGGYEAPTSTSYQARVPLEYKDPRLLLNLSGSAKIHAGYTNLAQIIWRYVRQTFTFS